MAPVDDTQELLASLVSVDTTSVRSNLPLLERLAPHLSALGMQLEWQRYTDGTGVEKANLIAWHGTRPVDRRVALAVVGHTDCVPFDPTWSDACRLVVEGDKLIGRGACDTKSFIAASVVAYARAHGRLKHPVALVFTADEEIGCLGAARLRDAGLVRPRYALVGEPTQLVPVRANKGYCLAEVTVVGREGHSAYPDTGINANFLAARLLGKLERYAREDLRIQVDGSFEPPFTTLNVGLLTGGRAKNVIPGECRFTLEWRPIPSQPVEVVLQRLRELIVEATQEDERFCASVQVLRTDAGFQTSPTSPWLRFLEQRTGQASTTVPFGTEGPHLTALGAEAVVLGAGDIRVAHQTGEYVPRAQLEQFVGIVEDALVWASLQG